MDVGVGLGRVAEVRLGTDIVHTRGSRQVGDPGLPDVNGTERRASLKLEVNGQDGPIVPGRGVALTATLQYYFDTAAAVVGGPSAAAANDLPGRFWQGEVTASVFHRVRGEDRLFTYLGAGTSFDSTPPLNRFPLGGPLRLSAYRVDELHGAHYLYGAAGYLIRAARLPDLLGGNFYVGAWLEVGSAFDARRDASWVDCAIRWRRPRVDPRPGLRGRQHQPRRAPPHLCGHRPSSFDRARSRPQSNCTDRFVNAPSIQKPVIGNVTRRAGRRRRRPR